MSIKLLTEKDKLNMQLKYGVTQEDIPETKCYNCENFQKLPDCSTECTESNLINYRPVLKYCSKSGLPCGDCNCK